MSQDSRTFAAVMKNLDFAKLDQLAKATFKDLLSTQTNALMHSVVEVVCDRKTLAGFSSE